MTRKRSKDRMAKPHRVTVARLPEINALVTGNEEKREEEERCQRDISKKI
jgi:hypothetical protein